MAFPLRGIYGVVEDGRICSPLMRAHLSLARKYPERWSSASTRRSQSSIALGERTAPREQQQQQQQPWFIPPYYRIFWCFHNISLVAMPVYFGMIVTAFCEGLCVNANNIWLLVTPGQ